MIKRFILPVLLSVLITAICVAQATPGYPYAAAPTSSGYNPYTTAPVGPGYNPYADPVASGYVVPYASAPALGYNPYAAAPSAPQHNPYAAVPAGPDPAAYGPSAYTAAPPTLTSEITPLAPPWETGAPPWPVAWPTQAAREWLPELADPWIPGTGKPIQYVPVQTLAPARALVPVSAATPVYLIVASSTIKSEPLAVKPEPSVDMQRSYPHNMVKVIPRMPGPQDTTQYWVQVGAYKTQVNAQQAFNRVMGAGFSPVFEEHRGLVRVLIPWVRGSKMQETAERLYNAGFMEILLWDKPPKS